MTVRMRHTRSHTANRRSHHALKEPSLSKCSHCGSRKQNHRLCEQCGFYKDRKVIDVVKQIEKKQKKIKEKEKEAVK